MYLVFVIFNEETRSTIYFSLVPKNDLINEEQENGIVDGYEEYEETNEPFL